jgi:serine phosphatase RsbU (regulator of sigma subunit)
MFTDGLVEACNPEDEQFGEDRLISIARENRGAGAEGMKTLLMQAASEHCSGRFQDDASMIVLRAV